jgi:Fur family zinc uptake transcriptional regulator
MEGVMIDAKIVEKTDHDERAIVAMVEHAKRTAKQSGSRLTAIREHVYVSLLRSGQPMKAYDILDTLEGIGAQNPPTVYRALDWLIKSGLVRKMSTVSKFVATPPDAPSDSIAYLLCRQCGQAEVVNIGALGQFLRATAKEKGFREEETVIELMGLCETDRCSESQN